MAVQLAAGRRSRRAARNAITVWLCLAVMGAMLMRPPWFWESDPSVGVSSAQFGAGCRWIWDPPSPPAERGWKPVLWWGRLMEQWTVVGVGAVVLMFLREARERGAKS